MKESILMFALLLFTLQLPGQAKTYSKAATKPVMAKCPVTGLEHHVKPGDAWSQYKGKNYSFCCPACKTKFDADPEKYLNKAL